MGLPGGHMRNVWRWIRYLRDRIRYLEGQAGSRGRRLEQADTEAEEANAEAT